MYLSFKKSVFISKLVILLLIIIQLESSAQEAIDYDFTITQSASLIDMSSGTTELLGANKFSTPSAITPIGFEVWFMGKRYTDFSVNCNGVLRFGTIQVHPDGNTYDIPDNGRLALFSCLDRDPNTDERIGNWQTSANGKVHYKIIGTAPQRQLVVEWKNLLLNFQSNQENATFQAVIYETVPQPNQPQGGQLEFIYGKMTLFQSFNAIRLGIGGENGGDEYMGIDLSTNPPSARIGDVSTSLVAGEVPFLNSSADGNRTKFTFLSPIPNVQAENLRTICNNTNGIQLDWDLDNSDGNIVGSVLYKSTDGTNYSFLYQTNSIQEIDFLDTDVDLANTYWYRVYTVTEGQLSELQASAELRVAPDELPEFDLGQFGVCDGDSATLDAGANYTSYTWRDTTGNILGTLQTQKVGSVGNYTVNVFNAEGCEELGQAEVLVSSLPVFSLESDYYFCEGESVTVEAPSEFALYEWFDTNDQKQAEGQNWQTSNTGNFYVKISNEFGCFDTAHFTLHVQPIPEVIITGEPFLCEKTPETTLVAETQNVGSDSLTYEWTKDDAFVIGTPEITINEIGTYVLKVSNTAGCSTVKTVEVINCCAPVLKIPNAFTPFSTPDNNEYRIAHQDLLTFNMKIYNRWGILIFETDDPDGFWDGTFNGKPLQPSVYQLIIQYMACKDGVTFQEKKTGAIYLLD